MRLLVGEGLDFYEGLSQYDSVDIYDKDGLRAGRIEVCSDGMFVAVCGGQWDNRDASVVCRQLGLSSNGRLLHDADSGNDNGNTHIPHTAF